MLTNLRNSALIAVLLVTSAAGSARAQAAIGTRPQGMAGAFVAVADDASAVYWNPPGIEIKFRRAGLGNDPSDNFGRRPYYQMFAKRMQQ